MISFPQLILLYFIKSKFWLNMRIRVERVLVVFIMHYYHFKDEMKCLSLRSISYSVVNTPRFFFFCKGSILMLYW